MRRLGLFVAISVFAMTPLAFAEKALIEFGWDEPDTSFLRAHLSAMERTPFDGCVFHVDAKGRDGTALAMRNGTDGLTVFTSAIAALVSA